MDRWGWVAVRAFGPAVVALLVGVVSMVVFPTGPSTPLLAGFAMVGQWIQLAAVAMALWLVLTPTYRLWRWQRGKGPTCPRCGGPLGCERLGYASRGGAYRCCYACSDNVNHRHYE